MVYSMGRGAILGAMLRRGFALLELILVIGLIGAITGVGIPLYRDYQIRNDLNLATEQVTQGLARARLRAQAAESDDSWGFYVPAGILYKGESYATRDPNYDETYPMPSTITIQGLMEVNYDKLVGTPDAVGEITLTTINDDTRNVLIEVKTESIAVVTADRFTICHNPGPSQHTLSIPDNAWPAHQGHGDAFGACASDASSSSAAPASSAQSSSVQSSSQSSSAAPGGESCSDRFAIDNNGTIRILGSLSVTFTSYGAEFSYGAGGPTVPVTVTYRKKNSGTWSNLFSGNAINGTGGATQTVTGFSTANNQNELYVRFKAYYYQSKWFTYENYAYTNDIPSVLMLRDGDTPPADHTLYSSLIAGDGTVSIGQYDVLLIVDFNREDCTSCSNYYCSNCSDVEYQDGVVLVRFNTPSC